MGLAVQADIVRESEGFIGTTTYDVTSQDLDDFRHWLEDREIRFQDVRQVDRNTIAVNVLGRTVSLHELEEIGTGIELHIAPIEEFDDDHLSVVEV